MAGSHIFVGCLLFCMLKYHAMERMVLRLR